jgi:hypothetical protein
MRVSTARFRSAIPQRAAVVPPQSSGATSAIVCENVRDRLRERPPVAAEVLDLVVPLRRRDNPSGRGGLRPRAVPALRQLAGPRAGRRHPRPPDRHGRPRHALEPMERRSRADSARVRHLPGGQHTRLRHRRRVCNTAAAPNRTRRAAPSVGRLRHAAELPLPARWRAHLVDQWAGGSAGPACRRRRLAHPHAADVTVTWSVGRRHVARRRRIHPKRLRPRVTPRSSQTSGHDPIGRGDRASSASAFACRQHSCARRRPGARR